MSLLAGLSQVAFAGGAEDAAYIAKQTVGSADYQTELTELNQQIFESLDVGLQRLGAEVIDPKAFIDELLGAWPAIFETEFAHALEAALTEKELGELAEFYRSDEGRSFVDTGELLNPVATLDLLRRLMAVRSRLEGAVAPRLEALFSPQRMADILEMPGIVRFEDQATRDEVVRALREVRLPASE